ncbi:16S rRNA (cytosine(1402)-N(4))-methyltransferase [bacterium E08(2017)]|nr:16S rRNA (cytosine(1402)-N(4))-methyltransferase [bacterium E08(2017)]
MHEPVLAEEVVELLAGKGTGVYIDGTLGSGGHSKALLESGEQVLVVGLDRDPDAIKRTSERLKGFGDRLHCSNRNFSEMADAAFEAGFGAVDGVLLDLGVSSEQLDEGERGFSILRDGPLDMRMGSDSDMTAEELVATASPEKLAEIFREYGEEKRSMVAAKAIIRERENEPIKTTGRLAEVVEKALGGRRGRIHPATRVFQAIRIFINRELEVLDEALEAGLNLLAPQGRLAVISYHSLEDRIVKRFMKEHAGRWESLQEGGSKWVGKEPVVKLVNKKPITPGEEELKRNSRARSAKLRVAERQ